MSGIAGIFHCAGIPANRPTLEAMAAVAVHRGPDGIGYYRDGPVGLAHLQLAVTPESLGESQPETRAGGSYAVTLDGRLDNRPDLIRDLRLPPGAGETLTDARLILEAYLAWGDYCVARLLGDFAFALWDRSQQRLLCARDPLGVRPFHYSYTDRSFIFGSEIKQILEHPAVSRELNELALGLFLSGETTGGEMTCYRAVSRLPGGHALTVSRDDLQVRRYWTPMTGEQLRMPDQEYEEQFLAIFKEAVAARLRSSGPVGVTLSGGMDSGSIACTAETLRRERPQALPRLDAFSWAFPEDRQPDPPHYIEAIREKYDLPLEWVDATRFWGLQDLGDSPGWDEPNIPPYEAQVRRTYRHISGRGIRPVLTGLGGDELLSYYWLLHLRDSLRTFDLKFVLDGLKPLSRTGRRRAITHLWPALTPRAVRQLHARRRRQLVPWLRRDFGERSGLLAWQREQRQSPDYPRGAAQAMDRALRSGASTGVMAFDQLGAQCGLELRHPFWDVRVVDFLSRIPANQKWRDGTTKSILRRAMRGIVPETVLHRPVRSNFLPFLRSGMRQRQAERLQALLERPRLAELGIVDPAVLRRQYQCYQQGDEGQRQALYRAIVTESWLRRNFPGPPGPSRANTRLAW